MSARSLNKVLLIGNLTRDPELRYTPNGAAVCTMGMATNRSWTTETGEKKDDVEYHKLVAWNKLAELCSQLLSKGRKVYIEGRLQTRSYTGQDGVSRTVTEIVMDDMIILDPKPAGTVYNQDSSHRSQQEESAPAAVQSVKQAAVEPVHTIPQQPAQAKEEVNVDDIPF